VGEVISGEVYPRDKQDKMSADLKALLEAQSDIHGRMSRSVDNLRKMGVNNITLGAIQARLTILDNLWGKIEAQHELIRAERQIP